SDKARLAIAAAFASVTSTRRFDEQLSHSACSNALEMKPGHGIDSLRLGKLKPSFVNQCRGTEGIAAVTSLNGGSETSQFLVGKAEQMIESVALVRSCSKSGTLKDKFPVRILQRHDVFSPRSALCGVKRSRNQPGEGRV